MADYELDRNGNNINYPNPGLMRDGGKVGNTVYPKVDMSLWDQATMCGTCHVGGVFYERDRQGVRLPQRALNDMGSGKLNPISSTVWENYSSSTGADKSFVTASPWLYPLYVGNNPANGAVTAPNGWGQSAWTGMLKDPNSGQVMPISNGQVMMPNVKEMDCLFCHLKGYDNVMASVATQAGSLGMAPQVGAGLMNLMPGTPTYQGYNGMNVVFNADGTVDMNDAMVANILPQPADNNCMQCHATKTLKNFPEMFGVTGTSSGFLSGAPMIYDPANAFGPLGKRMVGYDINAPFIQSGISPVIDTSNYASFMMPGLNYLQAMGQTPFNNLQPGQLGGGNQAMTGGPLYYYNAGANPAAPQDQNVLKRSIMPFPRAEWFKRGDAWQDGQDIHASFGCAGCHYTGDSVNKNQCDPGRGFDMASTIQDGIPHFQNRQPDASDAGGDLAAAIKKHDTRNTVKRCEFCHITGTDYYGKPINTFGAPDPTSAHQAAGLLANVTQIVDKQGNHGTFGGKGVPRMTNFTTQENGATAGGTILGRGNHLDVMDCTVCHVQKVSMAVRSLDATSGMRFPAIVGTDPSKGMLGLFEDPTGMGADATGMGGKLQEWKPIAIWQELGNMEEPLSLGNAPKDSRFQFRRKLYLTNFISAVLWNNEDPAIDANGDSAPGGYLIGDVVPKELADQGLTTKPSLRGYRDIFTGDIPDANNTPAFGLPIFDPWVQHDLKAGFNFGPAPLSVISIGFGGFGTPDGVSDPTGGKYQSLYGPDGMFSNDNWKYASVWSGAVVFTEPDQIANYKAYRTAVAAKGDGKSWNGTTLTYVGAPFMVTHGVKPVTTYVKGKSCADCHASGAGFFNGGFDMVGSAIPSTQSYDPTAALNLDSEGNLIIDPATGDATRVKGQGSSLPGNMMMRPLEPVRVKANKGDLRAYIETHNKLGQPREVSFVQETTDGKYSYISTVQRSQAMYPDEDGAIYFKASDISATGKPNSGAVALRGSQYANYLETGISATASGIGIDPVAVINPIADADSTAPGVQVIQNSSVALSAADAQLVGGQPVGSVTYSWTYTDGTFNPDGSIVVFTIGTGQNVTANFSTSGNKTITLTVTDEEGKVVSVNTSVQVVAAGITVTPLSATHGVGQNYSIGNLPSGWSKLKVAWGDGVTAYYSSSTPYHSYALAGTRTMQIYVYNSLSQQIGFKSVTISVK